MKTCPAEPVTADQKARAATALSDLLGVAGDTAASALRGEAAAQESCRLQCKGIAGAVMAGAGEDELVRRYADLRREHAGRAPWGALNRVIEAALGDAALERIKLQASRLVAAAAREVAPAASVKRGAPRYSQRFGRPHRA